MTPVCRVDGCSTPAQIRGICHRHYQAWRHGYKTGAGVAEVMLRSTKEVHSNPWVGRQDCPICITSTWTMPLEPGSPVWRCVSCHENFRVPRLAVA